MENNYDSIFLGLNPQQKKAVENTEGPCLIVAGAGSGKTRVLTSRIANLLSKGVHAGHILALTFTKKAAGEMKERIAGMVGADRARRLFMGTFHSVFIRILRGYAPLLGYPEKFTIYDTSDSQATVKICVKELGLDEKTYKPKDILSRISLAKNALRTPEDYCKDPEVMQQDRLKGRPDLHKVYTLYQQKLKLAGVMDFDDILVNMYLLLSRNEEARRAIAGCFDYVLVDEYQDTNMAQYQAIRLLCMNHRNICVVGDDSQSIYGFRGARIENILGFQKDFPEARVYRLEQNYRSTQNIVDAANSLIARNNNRIPKTCFSERATGDKIKLVHAYSEPDEARQIASAIVSRMQKDHAQYQDFAVLYRMNAQSRAIEEALRTMNLPYIIYSGHSFFDRTEVKDMMGYFKLCANPSDDAAFRRIIAKPSRGIGGTTVDALAVAAMEHGMPMMTAICELNLEEFGVKPSAAKKLAAFRAMIMKYNAMLETCGADKIAKDLANESGLYAFYKGDTSVEGQSRTANVDELLNSISAFIESKRNEYREEYLLEHEGVDVDEASLPVVTLGEWIEDISLLSSVDVDEEEDSANRVKLMTVHSSKGLEFPYVIVAGMEEGIFPSGGMSATYQDIEEERRLFYVAMTRAKQAVILSYCDTRMRNGKHESNSPSRFLREIAPKYILNPLPAFGHSFQSTSFGSHGGQRSSDYGSEYHRGQASFNERGQRSENGSYSAGVKGMVSKPFSGKQRPSAEQAPVGFRSSSTLGRPLSSETDFPASSPLDFRKGQRVEHSKFGFGTIIEIDGNKSSLKARVNFEKYGEKLLLLNYAKMRILR